MTAKADKEKLYWHVRADEEPKLRHFDLQSGSHVGGSRIIINKKHNTTAVEAKDAADDYSREETSV